MIDEAHRSRNKEELKVIKRIRYNYSPFRRNKEELKAPHFT